MGFSLNSVGQFFKGVGKAAKSELGDIERAGKAAVGDIASGKDLGASLKPLLHDVGDAFIDAGGAAIGYAELLGLKFPVERTRSQVSPSLTRGSRLEPGDMEALKARGFKSVVNLCAENDDDSANAARLGMSSLHLPIIDNTPPTEAQMKQFLDFVTAPEHQPAYVHCEAGQGRTGVAVACYRMAVQGWSPQEALAEAKAFKMQMPDQEKFILKFGCDLAAGRIEGYPKAA